MRHLQTRLEGIVCECGVKMEEMKLSKEVEEGEIDEFTKQRRLLYLQVCEVERMCDERAREDSRGECTAVVDLTMQIRKKINDIEKVFDKMRNVYHQYAQEQLKKNNKNDEKMLQYRLSLKSAEDEIATMRTIALRGKKVNDTFHVSGLDAYHMGKLPQSEDKKMRKVEEKDLEIDNKLDAVHVGLKELREVADGMNERVDDQELKIGLLQTKIDDRNEDFEKKDIKLKRILSHIYGPDKTCFAVMLIFVIFGIVSTFGMLFLVR
ncbi:hypothetical protein EIN_097080 [Entamoeba invadens IP1]|uniref:t-SNARE coiled-coil homology domain-containing protein n=1 Tax=Entamoeba invadens IP1 TaxID=370355 RepID=A0A0A1U6K4_ENTIV|nr:hypothetical protein EIN_097080 [Entamoeba invadens IP1]ELP87441.1 hypothetical protein EIN_097080 [Entamoeba invadens IP1]|eukprot:XP_004254212.1 hypothetical protein EIN_097080 [Entamoeba invadens IP1]